MVIAKLPSHPTIEKRWRMKNTIEILYHLHSFTSLYYSCHFWSLLVNGPNFAKYFTIFNRPTKIQRFWFQRVTLWNVAFGISNPKISVLKRGAKSLYVVPLESSNSAQSSRFPFRGAKGENVPHLVHVRPHSNRFSFKEIEEVKPIGC